MTKFFAKRRDTSPREMDRQSLRARLLRDDAGVVTLLFGLASLVVVLFVGTAIDYSRALNTQNLLSRAADSAVLAAGRALQNGELSTKEIEDLALTYFEQNARGVLNDASVTGANIKIDPVSGEIAFSALATVETRIVRIVGFQSLKLPIASTSVFRQRDLEVGVALDITGSMAQVIGGMKKIDAMKDAVKSFVDGIIPKHSGPQRVRVGLAPYASAINLGNFALAASDGESLDGCVVEPKNPSPSDEFGEYHVISGPSYHRYECPTEQLVPLTEDANELYRRIGNLEPAGLTAGHIGIQWAWNIVSEHWQRTWGSSSMPDEYARIGEGKLMKAVIIMTDGEFNQSYHHGPSPAQAVSLCEAMKAKGVTVFTVGFGLGRDSGAIDTLKSCATKGEAYFATADNASDLKRVFEKFASTMSDLRLAR